MIPFRSENYLGIISGSTEKTLGIISGSGSFQGQFGDHFGVGDHFGGCTDPLVSRRSARKSRSGPRKSSGTQGRQRFEFRYVLPVLWAHSSSAFIFFFSWFKLPARRVTGGGGGGAGREVTEQMFRYREVRPNPDPTEY